MFLQCIVGRLMSAALSVFVQLVLCVSGAQTHTHTHTHTNTHTHAHALSTVCLLMVGFDG